MSSHLSIWKRSPNKLRRDEIWLECFYFTSLFLVALILFSINLGNLPLLDFGEGTVARVAQEIVQQPATLTKWIFPTLWGEPFLERPPLTYDLIAIAYNFGINEFTTRFPGALLGAISVVLVYSIGREIYVARFPALFSALVYLTCLPVVRYSRLAMSDGPLLCFELLAIWAVLRSRRDFRWSLAAGLGLGLMALTKGIVSLQILIVLGVFLLWDTPRLIASTYFLTGIFLGLAPAIIWYASLWFHYPEFSTIGDSFNLISDRVAAGNLSPISTVIFYFSQVIQYILPWLIIMLAGTRLATHHVHWGWGKLLTAWIGIYLALSFLSFNRDYGAILLVYPALALAAGKQLDLVHNLPSYISCPRIWTYSFALMAVLTAFAGLHWGIRDYIDFYLPFICGSLTITFAATAIIIARQGKQFISILFWGLFVSFFLLFLSPHWLWELNTTEPVKPVAKLVKQYTPKGQIVYTSKSDSRPSLEFYSDRQIIPQKIDDLKYHWQNDKDVYLLVDFATINELNIPDRAIVPDPEFMSLKWKLAFQKSSP